MERVDIMRMKNNQGQMRIIETILAAIIIASALFFVNFFSANPRASSYEVSDLEKMGYNVLLDLDQHGILTPMVYQSKWPDLRTALKLTLPVDVYFNLTVYELHETSLSKVDDDTIRYGDLTTFSNAKNLASVSYSLVGTSDVYTPRLLVLQITRG
jgi:hypothetical protein